ncbi:hypothetical protein Cgig2_020947 [Carnegiea gigantea]|uniref:Uncharacterized protein n=1 Tax=Carnegiea gigantea TaxID=171969 RepID=A0A9Q1JLX0_9CARY|nr:hypothetical protein Cgig2_020947 [Carnegiea gigantea]
MATPILGFGGQEVNPMGMILLPVRFGDKSKFKSLEVDFLVVDVPTAYNLIIGRPTLHRVKAVGDKGYTSSSLLSSRSSSSDTPASASKGLAASSSAASPSDEGGINSTSSESRPSAAAHSRLSTKRSVSDIERRAPLAVGTLQPPLPLRRRHQPWPSPPRRPSGGPKPQGSPGPRI